MTNHQLTILNEKNIWQAIDDYKAHTYSTDILDDISGEFVLRLAKDNVTAKAELRDLFSKSPAWNEDLQAIIINGSRTHNPDQSRIYRLAHDIFKPVRENVDRETQFQLDTAISFFAKSDGDLTDYIQALNALAPKAYTPNKKKSRVFKALCKALGIVDETAGSDFQRLYAQIADELSAKKIDFKLFVSINPAHFLTMSNPKNDDRGDTLTSCHSFNKTDYTYNCGCSGYARDNFTFIVFTAADPDNPETLNNRKTTRQIFAYKPGNGLLLQSRMYNTNGGTYGAQAESKVYRDLIQRELSALEDVPNLWKTYTYFRNEQCEIRAGIGFGGYADWYYKDFDAKISIRSDHADDYKTFTVGTYGLCISCAEEIDEGLYCHSCNSEDSDYCEVCGDRCNDTWLVHDRDGNELLVCESCLEDYYSCCDECYNYYHRDTMTLVDDYHFVCQHCLEELYSTCDYCEEVHRTEDLYSAVDEHGNDVFICEDCRSDYVFCDSCNRYVHEDYATKAHDSDGNEVFICPECRDRDYQECSNCEGVFHDDLMQDHLCPDCRAHHQEEQNHSEVTA